mgnify:CR=1 FL=1
MAKLMFIHHSGLVGGAGVSLINVIKSVSEQHEVFVYVPCEPNDMINLLKQSEKSHGIKVKTYGRRIGAITYYSGGDTLKNMRFWYRILLIFKQLNQNQGLFFYKYDLFCLKKLIGYDR